MAEQGLSLRASTEGQAAALSFSPGLVKELYFELILSTHQRSHRRVVEGEGGEMREYT